MSASKVPLSMGIWTLVWQGCLGPSKHHLNRLMRFAQLTRVPTGHTCATCVGNGRMYALHSCYNSSVRPYASTSPRGRVPGNIWSAADKVSYIPCNWSSFCRRVVPVNGAAVNVVGKMNTTNSPAGVVLRQLSTTPERIRCSQATGTERGRRHSSLLECRGPRTEPDW